MPLNIEDMENTELQKKIIFPDYEWCLWKKYKAKSLQC